MGQDGAPDITMELDMSTQRSSRRGGRSQSQQEMQPPPQVDRYSHLIELQKTYTRPTSGVNRRGAYTPQGLHAKPPRRHRAEPKNTKKGMYRDYRKGARWHRETQHGTPRAFRPYSPMSTEDPEWAPDQPPGVTLADPVELHGVRWKSKQYLSHKPTMGQKLAMAGRPRILKEHMSPGNDLKREEDIQLAEKQLQLESQLRRVRRKRTVADSSLDVLKGALERHGGAPSRGSSRKSSSRTDLSQGGKYGVGYLELANKQTKRIVPAWKDPSNPDITKPPPQFPWPHDWEEEPQYQARYSARDDARGQLPPEIATSLNLGATSRTRLGSTGKLSTSRRLDIGHTIPMQPYQGGEALGDTMRSRRSDRLGDTMRSRVSQGGSIDYDPTRLGKTSNSLAEMPEHVQEAVRNFHHPLESQKDGAPSRVPLLMGGEFTQAFTHM